MKAKQLTLDSFNNTAKPSVNAASHAKAASPAAASHSSTSNAASASHSSAAHAPKHHAAAPKAHAPKAHAQHQKQLLLKLNSNRIIVCLPRTIRL
ncbi:MAG: hypothetical protein R3D26_16925 [Cyanobacteriota/Melainabacteria group bacterium]